MLKKIFLFSLIACTGVLAETENSRAYEAFLAGRLDRSISLYAKALKTARQNDDLEGRARCNLNLGHLYLSEGNTEKAAEHLEQAEQIYTELNDPEGMASVSLQKGKIETTNGNTAAAEQLFERAEGLFETAKSKRGQALCHNERGILYLEKGEFGRARKEFNKALERNKKEEKAAAANISNIGKSYLMEQKYTTAIEYFLKALELDKESGNITGRAVTLLHLANANAQLGKTKEACFHLDRAKMLGIPDFLSSVAEEIQRNCGGE